MRTIVLIAFFLSSLPMKTAAENWPWFRGPSRQGNSSEAGLPIRWGATENIAWKTSIPGEGWSSPIVWNNYVFLTTATEGGAAFHVLALDRSSGKLLWNTEIGRQVPGHKQGRNGYATPTPCTDGKRVYACFGDGTFVALDFDGQIVWVNRELPFYGEHGLGTSPLLWEGLLIMTRDGSGRPPDTGAGWHTPWDQARIYALDAETGALRWQARRGLSRIAHVVPNIWTAPDGHQELISGAGDVVQGFDLKTGERLWTSKNIGEGVVPSIVIGDNVAFTASGWGGRESIKAFKLGGSGDLGESNLVWEQKKGATKIPSYVLVKPYLFAIHEGGVAVCLKADTGEVVWQERVGGNFSASPVSIGNLIYLLSDDGETTVLEAGPEFKVVAKNPLREKCQASMAVSGGRLFIRTATALYAVGKTVVGPVAHWKLDEPAGNVVDDATGHGNSGELRGAKRTAGRAGGGIECGQDALVEIPYRASLDNFPDGLTVAAWVKRSASTKWNMIISREVKDGPSEYFGLAVFKNRALFSVDPDGAHYQNIQSAVEVPVGDWVHLAGTYDNKTLRLYVDGKLANSAMGAVPFQFADQNPLLIGGNTNNQGQTWVDCFLGLIDDVRLYPRALSAAEVAELWSSNGAPP